jgi:hypothetical protein
MNWDRGLKRITLVLSIIVAFIVGGLLFIDAVHVLYDKKFYLNREYKDEFDNTSALDMLSQWQNTVTYTEQNQLWHRWTGLEIDEKPMWLKAIEELERRNVSLKEETKAKIEKKIEQLEKLKEVGWQTVKGERLTLTPEDVWQIRHNNRINNLETAFWDSFIEIPIFTVIGAFLGFGAVWAFYAVTKWLVWPVYKWISRGFAEETKNGCT